MEDEPRIFKLSRFRQNDEPFYRVWLGENETWSFENAWSDDGYDPTKCELPRDVQLLCAMNCGKSDIDNSGLYGLLDGYSGIFAPEMVEWCKRSGLDDVSNILEQAIAYFGPNFPRDVGRRHEILDAIPAIGERSDWDPFYRLDNEFFRVLSNNGNRYTDAANHWLRVVCGVGDH
ncbi:DMP19 family protein [Aureliella helgolandensis]|nr:DUF4375 domain-containing protein [Aureliella helgolandensis]